MCVCMWESVLPNQNNRLYAFIMSYLKYIFIEQPCPKHSDTMCADDSVVPSQQIQGLYLLTVQVEGHRIALNAVGYPVPSARRQREWELTVKPWREVLWKFSGGGILCLKISLSLGWIGDAKSCFTLLSSQAKHKCLWAWDCEGLISLTPLIKSNHCRKLFTSILFPLGSLKVKNREWIWSKLNKCDARLRF